MRTLCAALAMLAAPVAGHGADVVLTMDSYGSVRIGMAAQEAYRQLQLMGRQARAPEPDPEPPGCSYYEPADGLSLMLEHGRIVRIETNERDVVTPSGIRVGSSIDKVRSTFGKRLSDVQQFYEQDASERTLTLVSRDGKIAMRFEAGAQVEAIYAGFESAIHYIEGCD